MAELNFANDAEWLGRDFIAIKLMSLDKLDNSQFNSNMALY